MKHYEQATNDIIFRLYKQNIIMLWSMDKQFSSASLFFFLSGFSFRDTDDSQDSRGRDGTIFYSTLPLPPANEYSDIYLQLCMWDDYHIFLIAPLVFTRLLLTTLSNYHLIDWWCDTKFFCLFTWWFDSSFFFVTAIWDGETGGFELVSTITLVLQANQPTKCASHHPSSAS